MRARIPAAANAERRGNGNRGDTNMPDAMTGCVCDDRRPAPVKCTYRHEFVRYQSLGLSIKELQKMDY